MIWRIGLKISLIECKSPKSWAAIMFLVNLPFNLILPMTIYSSRRQPTDRRAVSRSIGHTLNRTLWAAKFARVNSQLHPIARSLPDATLPLACNFRTDAHHYDRSTASQWRRHVENTYSARGIYRKLTPPDPPIHPCRSPFIVLSLT